MFDLSRPTPQTYAELQLAFDHFNERLFDSKLPACLLTLQREKRTHGYFSAERFVHRDGKTYTDEIALNPSFFSIVPPLEVMQTIVHEMVHAWQFHFGEPSRRTYHNTEWADKMEAIGLMPSDTGEPGGKRTGEKMADYSLPGGRFDLAAQELLTRPNFALSWYDRFPPEPIATGKLSGPKATGSKGANAIPALNMGQVIEVPEEKTNHSNRVKMRCPSCENQAWCKPKMKLICGEDECNFARMQLIE